MNRTYNSCIYRYYENKRPADNADWLFIADWENKTVLSTPEKPPAECVLPARFEARSVGLRGLTWFKDRLWTSGASSGLLEIDPDTYQLIKFHSLPEISEPHQIKAKGDVIHIANTGRDSVLEFDGVNVVRERKIVDMPGVPELIEPYLPEVEKKRVWGENRLHFNALAWDSEGNEYHTYMRCHSIFDVTNQRIIERGINQAHDLEVVGANLFYSSSGDRSAFSIKITGTELERACLLKEEIPDSELEARKSSTLQHFPYTSLVRGIAHSAKYNLLFVAHAPGTLVCLDLSVPGGKKVGEMQYCNSRGAMPFDILLDPRDWE